MGESLKGFIRGTEIVLKDCQKIFIWSNKNSHTCTPLSYANLGHFSILLVFLMNALWHFFRNHAFRTHQKGISFHVRIWYVLLGWHFLRCHCNCLHCKITIAQLFFFFAFQADDKWTAKTRDLADWKNRSHLSSLWIVSLEVHCKYFASLHVLCELVTEDFM